MPQPKGEILVPLDESDFLAHCDRQEQEIRKLKAALADKDKSWRSRDPYLAFDWNDAAKKDNCWNCVHARPATLPSIVGRVSCKYVEGWPHWSTRCNKWEKKVALQGEEEKRRK